MSRRSTPDSTVRGARIVDLVPSIIASCIASIAMALMLGSREPPPFKRMADGKAWTTRNLDVDVAPSYCYDDADANCRQYGRLYTWESAQRACQALGDGWRLPTNDEWRRLATAYGGLREDTADQGRAAYAALIAGGRSGFDAVFGGGRTPDGQYARGDAHGFYWTASETGPATAWFYNLGREGQSVNRHGGGEKLRAFAVRCVDE
jgi:uncharacterized protein (TIGR02145 family)